MLSPVRTAAPSVLPVSLDEVKAHLRVDTTDEDALIVAAIEAATARLDGYSGILGRALISQTWRQDFDGFGSCMRMPVRDLISVLSVSYSDTFNVSQTLAASVYTAFTDARGPYVALKPDQKWPSTYGREDAVCITWTAGYGTAAESVPPPLRWAIRLMVGDWFRVRENTIIGTNSSELPTGVAALIDPYIVKGGG